MASLDDADRIGTIELYRFPEHVDEPYAVYAVDDDPDGQFEHTKTIIGEGDTLAEAFNEAGANLDELPPLGSGTEP